MADCTPPAVGMGWKGYLLVGSAVVPYLSEDFAEQITHIPSDDIHGGGVGTAHGAYPSEINAAPGKITYEGKINGNVYVGSSGFGTGFKEFLKRAIGGSATDVTLRECGFDSGTPLILSPGGVGISGSKAFKFPGADGRAVVSTLSLSGNPEGLVTWDAEVIASSKADVSTTPSFPGGFTFESGTDLGAGSPVPWFESNLTFGGGGIGESGISDLITDWSINVTNQTRPVWTFNGSRTPRDIYQGRMIVTGSFTYYSDDGDYADLLDGASLTITLGDSLGAGALTLFSPYLALDPRPITSSGPDEITQREVTFRCLGSSSGGSLYIL